MIKICIKSDDQVSRGRKRSLAQKRDERDLRVKKMTQVVTVSATTAAYAAEPVKPSARVRGDGPADEAITLLSAHRPNEAAAAVSPAPVARTKGALSLALMLMSAEGRPQQESETETLRRYLEYMQDEENGDTQEDRQEKSGANEEKDTDEVAAMLEQFIRGA